MESTLEGDGVDNGLAAEGAAGTEADGTLNLSIDLKRTFRDVGGACVVERNIGHEGSLLALPQVHVTGEAACAAERHALSLDGHGIEH